MVKNIISCKVTCMHGEVESMSLELDLIPTSLNLDLIFFPECRSKSNFFQSLDVDLISLTFPMFSSIWIQSYVQETSHQSKIHVYFKISTFMSG